MKAAIISLGSTSSKWVAAAMQEYFKEVDQLNLDDFDVSLGEGTVFYDGKPLPDYDCLYLRGSHRYANLLSALTTILQKNSYVPLSASAFQIGHDKLLTHLRLQVYNIPQPRTYLVSTSDSAKKVLKQVTYPVILKLPGGTHGKGVMIADSPESAKSMMDVLSLFKQSFLVQEYIETDGQDIRAMVVGDKVVAAMKRTASQGEKRANIHAGATGEKVFLDNKAIKVAVDAARACRCDVCAVDILQSNRGPLVLEINLSPGLQGITRVTKVNVAQKIAQHLYAKTKAIREGKEKEVLRHELASELEIHSNLDFRGDRILLPEIVTKTTKFNSQKDVVLKIKKGKLNIEELNDV